jgi:hypothetical protein
MSPAIIAITVSFSKTHGMLTDQLPSQSCRDKEIRA